MSERSRRPALATVLRASALATALVLAAPSVRAADALERAQQRLDAGQPAEAVIELKNRLQQQPDDGAARRLLGIAYVRRGDGAAAEQEFARAARLGVTPGALALPRAEALAVQGAWQRLLDETGPQSGMRARELAELRALRASANQALGRSAAARELFEAAVATDAGSPRAQLGLAQFDLADGRAAAARQRLETLLAQQPAPTPAVARLAWGVLADAALAERDYPAARTALDQALQTGGDTPELRLRRALVRIELGDDTGARADLEAVGARLPDQPLMHYGLGVLALRAQRPAEAVEAFERALQRAPEAPEIHEQLARARLALGEQDRALQELGAYFQRHPEADAVARLLGRLRLATGDAAGAEAAIRPVLDRHPDDAVALEVLGSAALRQGRLREGERWLRRVAELEPDSAAARYRHGLALLALGEADAALEPLAAAAAGAPDATAPEYALLLGRLLAGRPAEALKQAEALAVRRPEAPEPLLFIGAAHEALHEPDAARTAYALLMQRSPGQPQAGAALALLELRAGRPDAARAAYRAVLERSPAHAPTLLALARLEWLTDRPDAAIAALEAAIRAEPGPLEPRLLLARLHLQRGQPAAALATLDGLYMLHPEDETLLALLATAELRAGNVAAASGLYHDWLARRPDAADALYGLAGCAAARGDGPALLTALEPALRAAADDARAPALLERLGTLAPDAARAGQWYASLERALPEHPALLDHRGERLAREQGAARAAAYYALLRTRQPDEPRWPRREAVQREAAGDAAAAARGLEAWLERHPDAADLRLQLATVYERLGRLDAARTALERVVQQRPDDVLALNDLAWLLRESAPPQALAYAQRAAALAPDPRVLETLGEVLLAGGRPQQAIEVLNTASERDPGAASIRLNLARAQFAAGQAPDARRTLHALLADSRPFDGRAEAVALLKQVGN